MCNLILSYNSMHRWNFLQLSLNVSSLRTPDNTSREWVRGGNHEMEKPEAELEFIEMEKEDEVGSSLRDEIEVWKHKV